MRPDQQILHRSKQEQRERHPPSSTLAVQPRERRPRRGDAEQREGGRAGRATAAHVATKTGFPSSSPRVPPPPSRHRSLPQRVWRFKNRLVPQFSLTLVTR